MKSFDEWYETDTHLNRELPCYHHGITEKVKIKHIQKANKEDWRDDTNDEFGGGWCYNRYLKYKSYDVYWGLVEENGCKCNLLTGL